MMTNPLLLTFLKYCETNFNFLEKEYNYIRTQDGIVNPRYAVVCYQSNSAVLSISFNSYTFEIAIEISQNLTNARKFTFGDLVRFYHAESSVGFLAPQASTEERLEKTLLIIANFLEQNASDLIKGKTSVFTDLLNFIKQPARKRIS